METVIISSKNFEKDIDMSLKLTEEYAKSINPSSVKILTYTDGSVAAYFSRNGVKEETSDVDTEKIFYIGYNADAETVIKTLNSVMEISWEGLILSRPYITTAGNLTVAFAVAAEPEDTGDDDDYDDDDDEAEEE